MPRSDLHDHYCDVFAEMYPGDSVDGLLCRPHDAIEFAREVCRRAGKRCTKEQINAICRELLNARKRGDFK